jgi:t-SNARE complex subunit (syntaxin)
VGFLAHEVQEQFPFLVSGEKDGQATQSINYNGFIGILVKEMQDSKKEIQELKKHMVEIVDLKKTVVDLQQELVDFKFRLAAIELML